MFYVLYPFVIYLLTLPKIFDYTSNAVTVYPTVKNLGYAADLYFEYFQKTYNANVRLHLRGLKTVTLKIISFNTNSNVQITSSAYGSVKTSSNCQ
jgi:hypothetical protein